MPNLKIKGLDEYLKKIDKLANLCEFYVDRAIYKGAEVVADATKEAVKNIPVDNRPYVPEGRNSITQIQKNGLIESFGVAPLRNDNNFINVKTGFDGYNKLGQPNIVIARSLESGTSFMPKNPVITKATNSSKNKCFEAMQESLTKDIENLMK